VQFRPQERQNEGWHHNPPLMLKRTILIKTLTALLLFLIAAVALDTTAGKSNIVFILAGQP
jgi:hypothetical protein